MKLQTNSFGVLNGGSLGPNFLDEAAAQVSAWLENEQPYTKPKSSKELVQAAHASYYALNRDNLLGHVALIREPELPAAEAERMGEDDGWLGVPHYLIESLVVSPLARRRGLGGCLINYACMQAVADSAPGSESSHNLAFVSAKAAPTSLDTIRGAGFLQVLDNIVAGPTEELGQTPDGPKRYVSKLIRRAGAPDQIIELD